MDLKYQLQHDGQAMLQADLNSFAASAAGAEDSVFAELFRMAPDAGSVSRGILPSSNGALLTPGVASVTVNPFRAFVGSRTLAATDARLNWNDIRSGLSVAAGSTALGIVAPLAANASGSPRWDLVYATVVIDDPVASVIRKVKSPTTGVVAEVTTTPLLRTTVTVGVVAGTPSASPVWPTIPADSDPTYHILLAYVRVPNGFGMASTVAHTDIAVVAPCLALANTSGASSTQVPTSASALTTTEQQTWGAAAGVRPARFVPSSMTGGVRLPVVLSLFTASPSHVNGDVIDSRDWRGRYATYIAISGNSDFVHLPGGSGSMPAATSIYGYTANTGTLEFGVGQSILASSNKSDIASINGARSSAMDDGAAVKLYVDFADGGKLKVNIQGSPNCTCLFFVDFTGVFENAL
jgi:hypothetical protein